MKVKSRNVQFTVSFETGFPAFLLYAPFIGFPLFSTFYYRRRFTRLKGCSLGIRVPQNLARIGVTQVKPYRTGWELDGCPWVPQIYILFCRLLFLYLFCYFPPFFLLFFLFSFFFGDKGESQNTTQGKQGPL